jgi:hypothetical protein
MNCDILCNIIECSQSLDNYIKLSSLNKDTNKFCKNKKVINKILLNKNFRDDYHKKIQYYIYIQHYNRLEDLLKIYQDNPDNSELQNIYINNVIKNKYLRISMIGKELINYLCQILFFDSENVNLDFNEIIKIDFYLRAATYGKYKNGVSFMYSDVILDNFGDIISTHFINLKNINMDTYHDKLYKFMKDSTTNLSSSYTNINSQLVYDILIKILTLHTIESLPENFREVFRNLSRVNQRDG